jgi:release factor glutamine methyltransferase
VTPGGPPAVRDAVREATAAIAAAGSLTPRLDAELLLGEVLGVRRHALYAEPERVLSAEEAARYAEYVARRGRREPVAYIIGRRAFRTIQLAVGPGTLVPRPETETLVEVALEELARLDRRLDGQMGLDGATQTGPARAPAPHIPRLLDVGAGSGAVALALAAEHPGVRVVGVDIDARAVEYARLNAGRLGLSARVEFLAGDLYSELPPGARFDLIVSNPPYLSDDELATVQKDVRVYEPRHALVGGASGLEIYERLIPGALPFLVPGGLLAVEIHEGRAEQVRRAFRDTGRFADITVRDDLGGAPRVVCGRERR